MALWRLTDTPGPFWQHVREALLAYREAKEAYRKVVQDTTPVTSLLVFPE